MRRKDLVNVLDLVKPAIADPGLTPIFSHFCFTGDTVYGSNDELTIVGPCKTQDVFAVHANTLLGLLKNSRAEAVEFQLDNENVLVKAGKSRVKMPFLDKESFTFDEPDEEWEVETLLDMQFLHGLEVCLTTASRDNSAPAFMGVTLNISDGINLYSCDGDALTHYLLGMNDEDLDVDYTMSTDFCNSILRIGEKAISPESGAVLKANKDYVMAEFENGFSIYSRIIERQVPFNHAEELEKHLGDRVPTYVPIPVGFKEALIRATIIGKRESIPTILKVAESKIRMNTESATYGEIKDIVRIKGQHDEVEALVNAEKVLRALTVCDEIAIMDDCTCYRNQDEIFHLLGNMRD